MRRCGGATVAVIECVFWYGCLAWLLGMVQCSSKTRQNKVSARQSAHLVVNRRLSIAL